MIYSTSVLCNTDSESTMPNSHHVHIKSKKKTMAMLIVRGNIEPHYLTGGLPGWLRESACNAGDLSSIPGLGRSPGEGNGNPPQYSCLENPHGQRTLAGCSPWDHKESHMSQGLRLFSRLWTWKVLHFPFHKEIKNGQNRQSLSSCQGLRGGVWPDLHGQLQ